MLNQSEAFQKKERGETIPDVSFNVSDKALRIQEAKSKVGTLLPYMYIYWHKLFVWYSEHSVPSFTSLHFLLHR